MYLNLLILLTDIGYNMGFIALKDDNNFGIV